MTTTERIDAIRNAHAARRQSAIDLAARMPGKRNPATERFTRATEFTLGPIAPTATAIVKSLYSRFKLVYVNRKGQLTASREFRRAVYRNAIHMGQVQANAYTIGATQGGKLVCMQMRA